jgi:ankyrin repeat domain-containing protein 50
MILCSSDEEGAIILRSSRLIVFLGTPHRGSHLLDKTVSQIGLKIGKLSNREVPSNVKTILEPRANEAFIVNSEFMKVKGQIAIVNFYEQVKMAKLGELVRQRYLVFVTCLTSC